MTKSATSKSQDQPPHIDVELDPLELKNSGPRLVCSVRSDWITKKITFKQLTDGLSNQMVAMFPQSNEEQALIVRTYGNNSDLIVDREGEIQTMLKLAQYDMASPVLLTFNNGLLYTFLPGEQIDINDQKVDSLVAKKLAKYHAVPSTDENGKSTLQLVDKLRHYLNLLNGTNPKLEQRIKSLKTPVMGVLGTVKATVGLQSSPPSLDSLESLLDYSFSQLDDDLSQIESTLNQNWSDIPIVLCHNDTQSRNFLLDKKTNAMHIIDFEHSFRNLYLFDIENYFVEFAGLGSSPDWDSKYPSRERRVAFLTEYLKDAHFPSSSNGSDDVEKLCDRCHRLMPLAHLYWSMWALLEAMLNPEALSQFDYVSYSTNRFNQYKLHKSLFLASRD